MIALIRSSLAGQYGAALAMLRDCLEKADASTWLATVGRYPYWHVAYHVLFYADLYLSPTEQAFQRRSFNRKDYHFLGPQSWAPEKQFIADQPYDKDTLIGYTAACHLKAKQALEAETEATLAGPSGFSWLEFTRLELHLYNIRHLQHHVGQLGATLRRQQAAAAEWVMSAPL